MIYVRVQDGLGNQMFQYAAARSLARRRSTTVALDLRWYRTNRLREFGLSHFNIEATSVSHFRTIVNAKKVQTWRKRIFGNYSKSYFKEDLARFDPLVLVLPDNSYLAGWFQSERYFNEHADLIRKDFELKESLPIALDRVRRKMRCTNSVSVHVRRGDYAIGGVRTLPIEYYERAFEKIKTLTSNPTYYVFSDDVKWVKEYLQFNGACEYIAELQATDYQELALMSSCQQHIVANSSFSWWGAWLNPDPHKVVISPKKWYLHDATLNDNDVVPESWQKI